MSSNQENKPLARTDSSTSYHDEDFLKPATLSSNVNKWLLQMREGKDEINYAELAGGEAGASILLGKTTTANLTDLVDTQVQTDDIQASVTNPVEDPSTQQSCSHATTSAHSGDSFTVPFDKINLSEIVGLHFVFVLPMIYI